MLFQGINAMEKFSHQYHMHEIFTKAAKIYNELLENPPKNDTLCMCANDVTSNGILAEVRLIFNNYNSYKII